eukprot:334205-Pleurochrysis_carterae.AAC.1
MPFVYILTVRNFALERSFSSMDTTNPCVLGSIRELVLLCSLAIGVALERLVWGVNSTRVQRVARYRCKLPSVVVLLFGALAPEKVGRNVKPSPAKKSSNMTIGQAAALVQCVWRKLLTRDSSAMLRRDLELFSSFLSVFFELLLSSLFCSTSIWLLTVWLLQALEGALLAEAPFSLGRRLLVFEL